MHTTLIYNQQAGNSGQPGPEALVEALRQLGFECHYHPTSSPDDLDHVLDEARDLVVVAGGDGSLREVAIRLLGRNTKITPLPMGTANNIARMLALPEDPLEIISGLADPVERDMDMGSVRLPQGQFYFLEAMGAGAFADGMKRYNPENGKSFLRSIQSIRDTMQGYQPKFMHINLDGVDLSGSYLMLEVMNTPTMSLRYVIAPDAKADDGLFDLVLVHASQKENYLWFMLRMVTGNLGKMPVVSIHRGSRLDIAWRGFPLHLDAVVIAGLEKFDEREFLQAENRKPLEVAGPYLSVEVLPQAIHFLLPKPAAQPDLEALNGQ